MSSNETTAAPSPPEATDETPPILNVAFEYSILVCMYAASSALIVSTRLPIIVRLAAAAPAVVAMIVMVHGLTWVPLDISSDTVLLVERWMARCEWHALAGAALVAGADRAQRILGAVSRGVAAASASRAGAAATVVHDVGAVFNHMNGGTVTVNHTNARRCQYLNDDYDADELMR